MHLITNLFYSTSPSRKRTDPSSIQHSLPKIASHTTWQNSSIEICMEQSFNKWHTFLSNIMYIMCILRTFASANLPEKYENPQSIYTNKKSLIANLIRRNRDSSRGVELQRSTPRRSVKVEAATRCSLCRQPIRHTKDCSISAVQWHTRSCTAGTRPVFLSTRSLPTAATPRGSNFGI